MKQSILLVSLLAAMAPPIAAQQDGHPHHGSQQQIQEWTSTPYMSARRGRGGLILQLKGIQSENIKIFPAVKLDPDQAAYDLEVKNGIALMPLRGQGAWHLAVASQSQSDTLVSVTTAPHFSKPGENPELMLGSTRADLEIVPVTLPREHAHYRAGQTWSFQVRYLGKPAGEKSVVFETSNGTRSLIDTDNQGYFSITFPHDFPDSMEEAATEHRPPKARFVLSARHKPGDQMYYTTFSMDYQTGSHTGRSTLLGGGFAVLGMLLAAPLLRRREKSND